ncbi:MAG TPA: hypothetical protein EYP14_20750, partial [Planctomycetaceae bacterium]|nr:hypothetical protein [Planctomycetaceae bacterium]
MLEREAESESEVSVTTLLRLMTGGRIEASVRRRMSQTVDALYLVYLETDESAWHTIRRQPLLSEEELEAAVDAFVAFDDFSDKRFRNAHRGNCERVQQGRWEEFVGSTFTAAVRNDGTYHRKTIPQSLKAVYRPLMKHARAALINALADRTESIFGLLRRFDEEYQRLKAQLGAYRFGDIPLLVGRSIQEGDIGQFALRLDADIAHLLLDEFQDTSLRQWQVIRPFAQAVADGRPGRSFFCVGDVKQAIYGWRGGISEIFDAVREELPRIEEQRLDRSWRSAPPIIETVNRVFGTLPQNAALKDYPEVTRQWTDRFHKHTTAQEGLKGYCRLHVARAAQEGERQKEASVRCAAELAATLARQHPRRSIAVLVRTNESVARAIFELRTKHGDVEASEEGGGRLTDSPAVATVLSLLHLADHPDDGPARFHVAHSPLGPVVGLVGSQYADDEQVSRLAAELRRRLLEEGYGSTVAEWVRGLAESCDQRELGRLERLVAFAYQWDRRPTLRATDFVDFIETARSEQPGQGAVRVMTIHQAKGLEFDIVVLAELEEAFIKQRPTIVVRRPRPFDPIDGVCAYPNKTVQQVLPDSIRELVRHWEIQTVSEALCVLYVAMTRAVHALYLVVPPCDKAPSKVPATYAGLLHIALANGQPLTSMLDPYQCGDPNWDDRAIETRAESGQVGSAKASSTDKTVATGPAAER